MKTLIFVGYRLHHSLVFYFVVLNHSLTSYVNYATCSVFLFVWVSGFLGSVVHELVLSSGISYPLRAD